MSSSAPSSTHPPCSTSTPSRLHPLTFWCLECDMSVSLLPSSSPPLCPQCCRIDTLLSLDSISPRSLPHFLSQLSPDLPPSNPTPDSASDDSFAAIPTVEIGDSTAVCAICKDDLPRGSFARFLPCSHLYHSDCIVPWLLLRNSCPLCRTEIPCTRLPRPPRLRPSRLRIRVLEPEDVTDVGVEASFHENELLSTQIGLEGSGFSASENNGEMVLPEWLVGGGWSSLVEDGLDDVITSDVWEDLFV